MRQSVPLILKDKFGKMDINEKKSQKDTVSLFLSPRIK